VPATRAARKTITSVKYNAPFRANRQDVGRLYCCIIRRSRPADSRERFTSLSDRFAYCRRAPARGYGVTALSRMRRVLARTVSRRGDPVAKHAKRVSELSRIPVIQSRDHAFYVCSALGFGFSSCLSSACPAKSLRPSSTHSFPSDVPHVFVFNTLLNWPTARPMHTHRWRVSAFACFLQS